MQNITAGDSLQDAQAILGELSLPSKGTLDTLIDELVAPVYRLFDTLGISQQILATIPVLTGLE